ncbi:MAG: hypothetical protein Kow00106_18190 [Anaerolineae bacterium]
MTADRPVAHHLSIDQRVAAVGIALLFVLTLVFYASPWDGGDDWETFHGAAWRVFKGEPPLYGEPVTHAYYSNPPWLAVILIPLALLPFRLGWAALAAATMVMAVVLLHRWERKASLVKPILVLLSPPMLYTIMHGQIDVLIVGGVLLPAQWWVLIALTKPQVALGLLAGIPRPQWFRAGLLTGLVIIVSLIWFGDWPRALVDQPKPFVEAGHNLWRELWPFQIPAGVLLIVVGIQRHDERLLIAGTPFLSPYAALSSLAGPWIASITWLNDWQAIAVFVSWWGAVVARAVGA